ncbi:basic proline-rich protein-like [Iris pallida]|uniref:Basic proline-rich protein-like n=1 Tax=Iris pallida TaxID=29817 RepID=A0AAX6H324_IRIPA|nr:basic proline-rich protein-like [Iris pallida]
MVGLLLLSSFLLQLFLSIEPRPPPTSHRRATTTPSLPSWPPPCLAGLGHSVPARLPPPLAPPCANLGQRSSSEPDARACGLCRRRRGRRRRQLLAAYGPALAGELGAQPHARSCHGSATGQQQQQRAPSRACSAAMCSSATRRRGRGLPHDGRAPANPLGSALLLQRDV